MTWFLLKGYLEEKFYFVTFCINFAVFLAQFILTFFPDKRSIYQYIEEDDVRGLPLSLYAIITELSYRIYVLNCQQVFYLS